MPSNYALPGEYYTPYQLNFRESVYNLNLNVVDNASTTSHMVPGAPVVTGPTTVYTGVENTYSMISTSSEVTAMKYKSSFVGSIITIFKKLFAQSESPKVEYMMDWGDGVINYTDPIDYGQSYSASHTWTEATTTTVRIAALDVNSNTQSDWTIIPISVSVKDVYTFPTAPVITGSICSGKLTISWDKVYRSPDNVQANPYKLMDTDTGLSVVGGGEINGGITIIQIDSANYNTSHNYALYAMGTDPSDTTGNTLIVSSPSTSLVPSNLGVNDALCNPVNPTNNVVDISIIKGMKFYAKPNWALDTGLCSFSGSVDATIQTQETPTSPIKTYSGVRDPSCSIDNLNRFTPTQSQTGSYVFSNRTAKIGKHSLVCSITYDDLNNKNDDGTYMATTTTIGITSKCSKAPTVIEK